MKQNGVVVLRLTEMVNDDDPAGGRRRKRVRLAAHFQS